MAAIRFAVEAKLPEEDFQILDIMARRNNLRQADYRWRDKITGCDQKGISMDESHLWGGIVRKMWLTETEKFRNHLLRLDEYSRRMRFGMAADDAFIENYASRIKDMQSLVYGCFIDGEMRGAAELRHIGDTWRPDAEAAFSVEPEHQNRGLGAELLGRVIRAARNRGIDRIYMNCLAENQKMQRLARKYEAELHFDHGEVVGKVVPSSPTYMTLWNEALEDSSGFVMAVLDLPLRLVPAA
jgi:RimJ/RimL family protein N-acetyltransferase